MSFFKSIAVKPWEAGRHEVDDQYEPGETVRETPRVALRFFLAIVTSLFFLFAAAIKMRMALPDWVPLIEPSLLWVNTAVLVLASVAFQWARNAGRRGDMATLRKGVYVAGALTIVFLVGQYVAWQELTAAGYSLQANPANAFFYVITGIHGLHIVGGLVAWGKTLDRLRGNADEAEIVSGVGLCATYWHYLLGVWIVMFTILLNT